MVQRKMRRLTEKEGMRKKNWEKFFNPQFEKKLFLSQTFPASSLNHHSNSFHFLYIWSLSCLQSHLRQEYHGKKKKEVE